MKLIVGLGNPGKEYEKTRHNAGFMVMDKIAQELRVDINTSKFKGMYTKINVKKESVILLKPQTYMNLSGESVREIMDYFKIDINDLLVIYDDLDLPVGKIRLRSKGSAGGQNGVKNIIQHLGTQQFNRIRVGIGKDEKIPVVDYVLGKVRKEDLIDFEEALVDAKNAAIHSIDHDFNITMSEYNKK
ncbi:MAG: aminoacyl-tRNA hydrolase [Erysipelotrichia bacterium]|nr:aminoacyl-tRNA hydrolase [Erysipelotrichia bacterium]